MFPITLSKGNMPGKMVFWRRISISRPCNQRHVSCLPAQRVVFLRDIFKILLNIQLQHLCSSIATFVAITIFAIRQLQDSILKLLKILSSKGLLSSCVSVSPFIYCEKIQLDNIFSSYSNLHTYLIIIFFFKSEWKYKKTCFINNALS